MLHDFQMFENYMASPTFKNLPDPEKEDFITSYNNLVEEEMDLTLAAAKRFLHEKSISALFFQLYGHLSPEVLEEKDAEWNVTFGFRPTSFQTS